MRSKDKARLVTLRMLTAAIKQQAIDSKQATNDSAILAIVEKMIKQRRESIKQYLAGQRPELADKEQAEIDILQSYLPEPLSDAEIQAHIAKAIESAGASSMRDMGKVMTILKQQLQGRADMGTVSAQVKDMLQ